MVCVVVVVVSVTIFAVGRNRNWAGLSWISAEQREIRLEIIIISTPYTETNIIIHKKIHLSIMTDVSPALVDALRCQPCSNNYSPCTLCGLGEEGRWGTSSGLVPGGAGGLV